MVLEAAQIIALRYPDEHVDTNVKRLKGYVIHTLQISLCDCSGVDESSIDFKESIHELYERLNATYV